MTDNDTKHGATSTSRVTTLIAGSYVEDELLGLQQRAAAIAPNARSADMLKRLRRWVRETEFASTSLIVASGQRVTTTLQSWVTLSWGYQWLTAEPEPDVIIIDLRDSVVVGPVIRLLDWFIPRGVQAIRGSTTYRQLSKLATTVRAAPLRAGGAVLLGIALLQLFVGAVTGSLGASDRVVWLAVATLGLYGLRETQSWDELRESRVVEAIGALLEPPTPPKEEPETEETATLAAETASETNGERK